MTRGWNAFLALLLPYVGKLKGIPGVESTPEFRQSVLSIIMSLGSATLMRENAEMYRHGMAECVIDGDVITFRMSDRCSIDHFLDRIEADKLRRVEAAMPNENIFEEFIRRTAVENLDDKIRSLVYPWRLNEKVAMTGYDAAPDIDEHYFALVAETTREGIDEAGIHRDTALGSITGRELQLVVFLLTSFYLKHIRFVGVAKKAYPEINYPMSLTIWQPKETLIDSITSFNGMDKTTVAAAIDLLTVRATDAAYFSSEATAYFPMLIEVSDNYLLSPVSSIFRNTFHGIRMLHEMNDGKAAINLRVHRERWMISELHNLFLGNRYVCMQGTTKLRRNGTVITDIDAAILDIVTGELALFQLKWQDFSSNDVTKQRSKAKNFIEKVDAWATSVQDWLAEFGAGALKRSLRIKSSTDVTQVRLFAIGRSAARFQSYGFASQVEAVASATWRQFTRLRYEVGSSENIFSDLHDAIQADRTTLVKLRPVRQEMPMGKHTIVFENLWNEFEEDDDAT
jgi:hypothetical protein